jgi:light-regulated signal transduction histidine kinase (bacteriophytochrome)
VEVSAKPLIQNGEISGAIAVVRDISARKEAEKEKRIRFELERSNTELEQFAHICSHDLQEPLRTMSSFAFLLKEKIGNRGDEETDEMITGLLDGATRMSFLINDLLEYAHVGATEIPMYQIPALNSLHQAIQNLQVVIKDNDAQITFSDLPNVIANDVLLVQVFQNLISNSIKFKSSETPHIYISTEQKQGDILFAVKDNGIGFKMEYSEKIFQVFKRLHHSEEFPGTGIGLGICKRIVERQGGRIWAQSEVGKGSTFYFTLQAAPVTASKMSLRQLAVIASSENLKGKQSQEISRTVVRDF